MIAEFSALRSGTIFDQTLSMYPSRTVGHTGGEQTFKEEFTHTFGFVLSGEVMLNSPGTGEVTVREHGYFSIAGAFAMQGSGHVAMFQRIGFRGLTQIGGRVEKTGRLTYIDNCMTSILISPPRMGDPCLNLLSFPPGVEQTLHVHPTIRLGLVAGGSGKCISPGRPDVPLRPGETFVLGEAYPHCFHSHAEGLLIMAYHPETDVGPTDQKSPMLSRTYRDF
jgi:hypothetical protein